MKKNTNNDKNKNKNRRWLLLILLLLLLLLNLCSRRKNIETTPEKPLVTVEKKFLSLYKEYPQVVKEILVEVTDNITSGAILITFDTSEREKLTEEKNQLKKWYEDHLNKYKELEKEVNKKRELFKLDDHALNSQLLVLEVEEKEFNLGGSSEEDLKFIRDYVDSLRVTRQESEETYRKLKKELDNYGLYEIKEKYLNRTKEIDEILPLIIDNIKSPINGGVEGVEVEVGQLSQKGDKLITLFEEIEKNK